MYIQEAIQARTLENPFILRKAWRNRFIRTSKDSRPLRLLPTNSPEGCVLVRGHEEVPRCGWQPTEEDLVADDWETVGAL